MNRGVNQKLFVKKNHHILDGTQDLRLYTKRSIGLAQLDKRSQDICIPLGYEHQNDV